MTEASASVGLLLATAVETLRQFMKQDFFDEEILHENGFRLSHFSSVRIFGFSVFRTFSPRVMKVNVHLQFAQHTCTMQVGHSKLLSRFSARQHHQCEIFGFKLQMRKPNQPRVEIRTFQLTEYVTIALTGGINTNLFVFRDMVALSYWELHYCCRSGQLRNGIAVCELQYFRDFLEELSRENEVELFTLRITFK